MAEYYSTIKNSELWIHVTWMNLKNIFRHKSVLLYISIYMKSKNRQN